MLRYSLLCKGRPLTVRGLSSTALLRSTRVSTYNTNRRVFQGPNPLLPVQRPPIRPLSFIFTKVIPRMLFNVVRIPMAFVGAGAGAAAYANYKIDQVSQTIVPEWLVDLAGNAKSWAQGQKADFDKVDYTNWFQTVFPSGANSNLSQGTGSMYNAPVYPPPNSNIGNGSYQQDGGGSSSSHPPPSSRPPPAASSAGSENDSDSPSSPENDSADHQPAPRDGKSEFAHLIKTLLEVQNILRSVHFESHALQLPSIVVIGSQSSGKSSVLEAIVGKTFLPKGSNMVTRRPIELTLIHTPHLAESYGEFPQLGLGKIHDFVQIQQTLTDLNLAVPESECVSDKPIDLRIYSPHVPDLRLVDLPGYIQVHNRNQPTVLKDKIRDLCERYIQAPNIILAVCAADVDLANSEALLASRRVDPLGVRTLGVVTKMDTVDPEVGKGILLNDDYPLQLGYVGVICKPVPNSDSHATKGGSTSRLGRLAWGESRSDSTALTENQFYQLHPVYQSEKRLQLGVPTLRTTLVTVLERHMANNLQHIMDTVQSQLDEARYQFKVHYSDQRISAESYVMDSLDQLKQNFREFTQRFGKAEIREEIRRMLESHVLNVCAQLYWDDERLRELGQLAPASLRSLPAMHQYYNLQMLPTHLGGLPMAEDDGRPMYWQRKLERSQSLLTKSGVGRWSTQLIVDTLLRNVQAMLADKPFAYHEEARQAIVRFSQDMLRGRYLLAVEQVENTLKPLKYEVECTPNEWREARERTMTNLQREIDQCSRALRQLRAQAGSSKLQAAIRHLATEKSRSTTPAVTEPLGRTSQEHTAGSNVRNAKEEATIATLSSGEDVASTSEVRVIDIDNGEDIKPKPVVYSPRLLEKARQVLYLRHRRLMLKYRLAATKIRACKNQDNRVMCPEVFLHMLSAKLAHNAVLFIQVELMNEFFFQFPRELDNRLYYGLSREQIYNFARENPNIVHQLDLSERKMKLEEAMQKLLGIVHDTPSSSAAKGNGSYDSPNFARRGSTQDDSPSPLYSNRRSENSNYSTY
ncbi:mitochondrial dynamin GTPase Msp1 [Dispira simplex]|nr:mitochondrial dynamin GTPase Msp1 [Dispira simplex]